MRILWRNFPIPEPFVVAFAAGGLLQIIRPACVFQRRRILFPVAAVLALAGVATAVWAVLAAGDNDLERPGSLVTSGPYAFSRNPMYVSWEVGGLGVAALLNSFWLAIAALGAAAYLHFVTIPGEEEAMLRRFGVEYEVYRDRVGRWF